MATRKPAVPGQTDTLLRELRGLIESARTHVAQAANATLTLLYWHVGQRIEREVLKAQRADCCDAVATIGAGIWQGIQCVGADADGQVCRSLP